MATSAQGTILKFTPSDGEQVTVGRLTSVGEIAPEAEAVDVTTLDSAGGYREYIQGFRDSGELEVTGFHDKSDAGQSALRAAFAAGKEGEAEICFADGTTVGFTAFVRSHTIGAAEVDGAVGFGAVLRITGAVTVTTA